MFIYANISQAKDKLCSCFEERNFEVHTENVISKKV
jgi:hypothetical protein